MSDLRNNLIKMLHEYSTTDLTNYDITDDTSILEDLDIDSLGIFQLMQAIEDEYDFLFVDVDVIGLMERFGNLYSFVQKKVDLYEDE